MTTEIPASLLQDIKENNLLTSVGYHFRYQENIKRLKETLRGDKVGMIMGQWMGGMPGVAWWRDQKQSGGQFTEQTTHIVDLVRYLAGEVKEVYGMFGNRIMHEQHEGVSVADVGTVSLKLENGIVANISNTCVLPDEVGSVGLSFYNDRGLLDWNPDRLLEVRSGDSTEFANTGNPYLVESEAFIHAVRTGIARAFYAIMRMGTKPLKSPVRPTIQRKADCLLSSKAQFIEKGHATLDVLKRHALGPSWVSLVEEYREQSWRHTYR